MKFGSIPKKVTLFLRQPTKVYFRWENSTINTKEFNVIPCFISDFANKQTLKTGEEWASRSPNDKLFITLPNEPFKLKIITLDIRDKGGRAYKVCADIGGVQNLYFDLREDVLLDSIYNVGILAGGEINASFIFARVGSQMKPIRIGSTLHQEMIASTELNNSAPCELKIGGIYKNKNEDEFVYLGERYGRKIEFKREYSYARGFNKSCYQATKFNINPSKKYHIFIDKRYLNRYNNNEFPSYASLVLVQKSTYKQYVGQYEGNVDVIEEIVAKFQNSFKPEKVVNFYSEAINNLCISQTPDYIFEPLKQVKVFTENYTYEFPIVKNI